MTERNIQNRILLATGSHPNIRLFRNNTGQGWQGQTSRDGAKLIITNPRPLMAGLHKGSSDLIGWKTVEVTPDLVGQHVAIFTAVEVKTGSGRTTVEQEQFLQAVRAAGGIGVVMRDESQVALL
jgi:hypothetical protein